MTEFQDAIAGFVDILKSDNCYSKRTIDAYKVDASQYIDYLQLNNIQDLDVNTPIVDGYVQYMLANSKKSTVLRKISSIKTFYTFLYDHEYVTQDPTLHTNMPKKGVVKYDYLNDDEINALLLAVKNAIGYDKQRNALTVNLLYNTGIHATELTNLDVDDIDFHNQELKINGPNLRILSLDDDLMSDICNYKANVRPSLLKSNYSEKALIVNSQGRRLSRQWIWWIVKELGEEAGLESKVNPNILRHTLAMKMLKTGHTVMDVQDLFGQKSGSTSQVYSTMMKNLTKQRG